MVTKQRATANNIKGGIESQEEFALRVMVFQGCSLLRIVTSRQNYWFNCVLIELNKRSNTLRRKRPELINRKCVVSTRQCETLHVINHPAEILKSWLRYLPDLTPTDYHLFRSLKNSLNVKTTAHETAVNTSLEKIFTNTSQTFCEHCIIELVERWRKVINNNGQYIIDQNIRGV